MEKKDINKEIEETLNSLDQIEKAGPSGLFYEKVMMRVERKEAKVVSLAPRLVWQAAACFAALVVLNVFVCLRFSKSDNNQSAANKNPVAEEYFSYLKTTQF